MTDHPTGSGGPSVDSLGGLVLVMFAGPLGYGMLFFFALIIVRNFAWHFSAADVPYWACAIAMPFAQRRAAKYQTSAEQAKRRVARALAVHFACVALVWVVAHSVSLP